MSDCESIEDDAAWDAMLEDRFFQHRADLQENAEAALLELLPNVDPDVLFANLKDKDIYGDPLHAAVIGLVDTIQEVISQANEQRQEALRKAVVMKIRIASEHWADRIQAAIDKKRIKPKLSASKIAKQVINDEIYNENITNDADLKYLQNTVSETFRKKLGKTPEYKAIK
jgi:hypothetical protein